MTTLRIFHWQGINPQGRSCQGDYFATSAQELHEQLKLAQVSILKYHIDSRLTHWFKLRPLPLKQRARLMVQLANALSAGLSLSQTLEVLIHTSKRPFMQALMRYLNYKMQDGSTFSQALSATGLFHTLEIQLIYTAEQSGLLAQTCEYLSQYLTRQLKIHQQLLKALSYPLFVLGFAGCIFMFFIHFIIPQFSDLFEHLHTPLPLYTQWVMHVSTLIEHHGLSLLLVTGGMGMGHRHYYRHHRHWQMICDRLLLHLPFIRRWVILIEQIRLSTTLSVALQSGLTITQGLNCAAKSCQNQAFRTHIYQSIASLKQGQHLSKALAQHYLFSREQLQLLQVGEESGALDTILAKITEFDDDKLALITHLSINLIEPVVMTFVGLLVANIIIALYLPIFSIGNAIH